MIYEYSSENRLEKPHNYMYTPYHGRAFLDAWKRDRAWCLDDGVPLEPEAIEKMALQLLGGMGPGDSLGSSTAARLFEICLGILRRNDDGGIYPALSAYIKRFEVKRLLHSAYTGDMRPDGPVCGGMLPYLLLSIGCGLYSLRSPNLKMVNCMLKLDDCIGSCRRGVEEAGLEKACGLAFALERVVVSSVAERNGVTL